MSWLQRTFPKVFGPEIPPAQLEVAVKTAGEAFGDPAAREQAYGLLAGVLPFGTPPRRGTRELIMLYSASPWLRAIVGRVAASVADTDWQVLKVRDSQGKAIRPTTLQRAHGETRHKMLKRLQRDGQAKAEPQLDHPMIEFLQAGNPVMSARTVHYLTQVYLELKGEAYWLIERWDSGPLQGLPRYAWPIPPYWVLMTPTVGNPSYRIGYNAWQVNIPETEIVAWVEPDPAQPYGRGAGIAQSLTDELSADEHASKLVESSLVNRNLPAAIVSMEGGDKSEAERIKRDWSQKYRGVLKAFQTHFTNSKINVATLSQSFVDMQVLELRTQFRDNFLEAWGYPKELLGIMESANRSVVDVVDFFAEKHVTRPRREMWRQVLQHRLMPEYDERGLVEYVDTVPADREFQLKTMQARPAAFDDDEVRELAGYEPMPEADVDEAADPQSSLNGAQVESLLSILNLVATGQLPRDSAAALIQSAFALSPEATESILGTIGNGFVPAPQPDP